MSRLKDKLKKLKKRISKAINFKDNPLDSIISKNKDYLILESKVLDKSEESVHSIIKYARIETPSFNEIIGVIERFYDIMKTNKKEKIEEFNTRILIPLKNLSSSFDEKEDAIAEFINAKKIMDKAQKKLTKEQSRSEDKRRPTKIDRKKAIFREAERLYNKNRIELNLITKTFEEEKVETMKKILYEIIRLEGEFYQTIHQSMNRAREIIDVYKAERKETDLTKKVQSKAIKAEES